MVIENVSISAIEKSILQKSIDRNMNSIFAYKRTNFTADIVESIWYLGISCDNFDFQIEREDINAKYFYGIEDGGRIKISGTPVDGLEIKSRKTINRVVRGISIIDDTLDIKTAGYKITYPKAIIFHFDDCNLIVEREWLFSLEGLIVHLEPLDAENFGLIDEEACWQDEEEWGGSAIFTQNIEKL